VQIKEKVGAKPKSALSSSSSSSSSSLEQQQQQQREVEQEQEQVTARRDTPKERLETPRHSQRQSERDDPCIRHARAYTSPGRAPLYSVRRQKRAQ